MVQDKKNFSSVKKNMDETRDQDKKGQARSADSSRSQSSSAGINKGQSSLSKDKSDSSKRDVNSRK